MYKLSPPGIDPASIEPRVGTGYPEPFRERVNSRAKRALGDALGLTHFGVNLVELPPGAWSSQRHWHSHEDEFVYVLEGELSLITDAGEQRLVAGMAAGFPAGRSDGHHLVNRSRRRAVYLEVGDRNERDEVDYPDIDMRYGRDRQGQIRYLHRNGEPYED